MDIQKILLVEDHVDSRRGLKMILQTAGYHVVEAGSVPEGVAKVDGQAFALLDLHLPDGEGTVIFNAIRKQAHPTRIAFITAAHDLDKSFQSLSSDPPDALFRKPIDLSALLAWLRSPS